MSGSGGPRVSLVSLGVGLAAAGVGAALGLAAERITVGRPLRPTLDEHGRPRDDEGFGTIHSPAIRVEADDGTLLHVEVDDLDPAQAPATTAGGRGRRGRARPASPAVTVVFSHGYALSLDSWHYQRRALRGRYRTVFWDQRGHGRSATGPEGSATIDQIGRDLARVIAAAAPEGPLVLVGHSMGGMTVMSLAEQDPAVFDERVIGVALISTSAGGLGRMDFGLPRVGPVVHRLAPATLKALAWRPALVERGRRIGSDLEALIVRRYSYASPVPASLVRFTADMIVSTRLEVISDFMPSLSTHDKLAALATLTGHEVLVLVGDGDLLTPVAHSEEIVRRLPGAEHVVVRDAGHLVMLEHPEVVTMHLVELVERARRMRDTTSEERRRVPLVRRTVTPMRRRGRRRDGAA
ncbi:MAG: alpha/beta fold hydrolase [Kineosporiaceae bacterium]